MNEGDEEYIIPPVSYIYISLFLISQKMGLLQSPNNSFVAMELLQCPFLYIQKEKIFPRDEQENDGAPSSKRIESTPACTTG